MYATVHEEKHSGKPLMTYRKTKGKTMCFCPLHNLIIRQLYVKNTNNNFITKIS